MTSAETIYIFFCLVTSSDTIYLQQTSRSLKKHFEIGQNMQNIPMHDKTLFNAKVIY